MRRPKLSEAELLMSVMSWACLSASETLVMMWFILSVISVTFSAEVCTSSAWPVAPWAMSFTALVTPSDVSEVWEAIPDRSSADVLTRLAWSLMAMTVPRSFSETADVLAMSSPSSSFLVATFFATAWPSSGMISWIRRPSDRELDASLMRSMNLVMLFAMKKAMMSMTTMMASMMRILMIKVLRAAALMEASETPANTEPMMPLDFDFSGT